MTMITEPSLSFVLHAKFSSAAVREAISCPLVILVDYLTSSCLFPNTQLTTDTPLGWYLPDPYYIGRLVHKDAHSSQE